MIETLPRPVPAQQAPAADHPPLLEQLATLWRENAALRAENAALRVENGALQERICEVEARLGQSSANSSCPPSSDFPEAPARPKAPPAGRERGGQPGHRGVHRALLPVEQVDEVLLRRGQDSPDKAAGLYRELTQWWAALWTLARVEGVEPTNNAAERALRPAVLWRKMSSATAVDFVHAGPDTMAGRYLRRFWQPVYRAENLAPGQAVPLQIMREHFTLYRGETGAPHVVAARCAHRGTQLSTGWVEGDCLRCLYHGWKYDATGQCVEQPGEDAAFAAKVRVRSHPTEEYLGLIFAYLGEGEPPPFRRFPDFELPGVVEAGLAEYWPCNYFNRVHNACDGAHVAFTHRESTGRTGKTSQYALPAMSFEETDYGIRTIVQVPGRPPYYFHFHMPDINQTRSQSRVEGSLEDARNVWVDPLFWRVPVDDERSVSFVVDYLPLTGPAAEGLPPAAAPGPAGRLARPQPPRGSRPRGSDAHRRHRPGGEHLQALLGRGLLRPGRPGRRRRPRPRADGPGRRRGHPLAAALAAGAAGAGRGSSPQGLDLPGRPQRPGRDLTARRYSS
jgi:5,5'-dehydrodivanillate O-demethylase